MFCWSSTLKRYYDINSESYQNTLKNLPKQIWRERRDLKLILLQSHTAHAIRNVFWRNFLERFLTKCCILCASLRVISTYSHLCRNIQVENGSIPTPSSPLRSTLSLNERLRNFIVLVFLNYSHAIANVRKWEVINVEK